jgi:hypothetical protein
MGYHLNAYTMTGDFLAHIGKFATVAAARQAMMDHSDTAGLPLDPPAYVPECGIMEGWFVGDTEYAIQVGQ